MSAYRHKILIYSGGNYSGCHWEWNWCLWDKNGNWHEGFASGCDGIKDEKLAIEVARAVKKIGANDTNVLEYSRLKSAFSQINSETALLDYAKVRDCKEITEWCATLVAGIVKYITEVLHEENKILIKCRICGREDNDVYEFELDDEHHQGLASWHESFTCNDCKSEFRCLHCGEDYRGAEEYLVKNDENHSPICQRCYEDRITYLVSNLVLLINAKEIDRAIECRKEIERRKEILAKHLGEDEDGEPIPEQEPVEDLLKNDTTPFLPWLFESVS